MERPGHPNVLLTLPQTPLVCRDPVIEENILPKNPGNIKSQGSPRAGGQDGNREGCCHLGQPGAFLALPTQHWVQSCLGGEGPEGCPPPTRTPPVSLLADAEALPTGCPTSFRHLGPPDVERVSCVQLLLAQVLWVSLGQMVSRQACWSPPSPGLLNCYAEPCKQAAATWRGAGVREGGLCPLPRSRPYSTF